MAEYNIEELVRNHRLGLSDAGSLKEEESLDLKEDFSSVGGEYNTQLENGKKASNPKDSIYYKDTIASMQPSETEVNREIDEEDTRARSPKKEAATVQVKNFFSWLWGVVSGAFKSSKRSDDTSEITYDKVEPVTVRPKLETPDHIDAKSLQTSITEMNHLLHRVKDIIDEGEEEFIKKDPNKAEANCLRILIELFKRQQENHQESWKVTQQTVHKTLESNKEIQKQYLGIAEENAKNQKNSKILGWVSTAGTIGMVLGALLGIFTGGISAIFSIAIGCVAIGTGSLQIGKGVLDYKSNKLQGNMFELKANRSFNHDNMKTGMQEMQQALDNIMMIWRDLSSIVKNRQQATK